MHMKDTFWLAACNARPNQHLVNKNFRANVNIFFGKPHSATVRQENFERCPASGIAKWAVATTKLEFKRRKDAIKFSSQSILRPSRSSDLPDKGRSAHRTACKADFSDYSGR